MTVKLNLMKRTPQPRKPLRTLAEMADEFGVDVKSLQSTIGHNDGPKAVLKTSPNAGRSSLTYYEPDAMRKWWKAHNESQ